MKKDAKLKDASWAKVKEALLDESKVDTLTAEEKEVYFQLNEFQNDADVLYAIQNINDIAAWKNVALKLGFDKRTLPQKVKISIGNFYKIAAVLVIGIGIFLWFARDRKNKEGYPVQNVLAKEDVLPGSSKAILFYNDKSIALDEKKRDEVMNDNRIQRELQNGVLVYHYIGDKNNITVQYDTIMTPRGGEYALQLEDGTKIWLNAASSISFPVPFSKSERCVTVSGEAYFEVAKNKKKPFIVQMHEGNKVTVLGTHFDVKAYSDEKAITTTLLEGKVEVKNEIDKIDIQPGEQSVTKPNGKIDVQSVDVQSAIAWKNGYFNFNNDDLETVMKQISRWYNVDVVYAGKDSQEHFYGEIQRSLNLSQILKVLEKSNIHFKIKNQTIIVDDK